MTEHDLRAELEFEIRVAGSSEGGVFAVLQEHCGPNLECAANRTFEAVLSRDASERMIQLLRAADDLRALRCRIDRCIEALDGAAGAHARVAARGSA